MKVCLHNSYRYQDGRISPMDVLSLDELKGSVSENTLGAEPFLQFQNVYIFPGFVDVHVHFREPGFSYKETVRTGALAAAHVSGLVLGCLSGGVFALIARHRAA